MMARATARVAPTIYVDVLHGQPGIVGATLAVALAVKLYSWQSFTNLVDYSSFYCIPWSNPVY